MAANARTEEEREFDLTRMAEWYRQGWTQWQMAERLGVTQQQVSYDLAIIRKRWVQSRQHALDEKLAKELEVIDRTQRDAEEAYERSKRERRRTVKESDKDGNSISKTVIETCGDPRWKQIILNCVDARAKLLGLNAPAKHIHAADESLTKLVDQMTDQELSTLDSILQRASGSCPGESTAPSPHRLN